ncbi:MAG: efflux transporter periplasmic adaptor subunit [Rhodospirillales bacterium]|nr:efflux transporter periplasmic adaptor subunit [Rhodospirillales bacterium]
MKPVIPTALLASLFLAGCDDPSGQVKPPPPTVTVAKPLSRVVNDWDEFTGRFEAVDEVELRARVSGYLQSVHFKDGQVVQKGDLLFVIDPRPYEAASRRAEADVAKSEARLGLAGRELGRAQQLLQSGNVSASIGDQRTQQRRDAEADLDGARASLQNAKLNLEFTRVTAPITGRISRKFVSEGNLVGGDNAGASLLTTLVSLDPIHFYFDIDERTYLKNTRLHISGLRPIERDTANPVKIAIADEREFAHDGRMDFIDNRLDRGSGTLRGRALVKNENLLFAPGQFGRVRLMGSAPFAALLIPDEAITNDQSNKIVFVLGPDDVPQPRVVTVAQIFEGYRVVRQGITQDDRIVIAGLQRVRTGQKVTPNETTLQVHTSGGESP